MYRRLNRAGGSELPAGDLNASAELSFMKVVVAADSFKGTLRADDACEIIADAIRGLLPDVLVITKPMADGGRALPRQ